MVAACADIVVAASSSRAMANIVVRLIALFQVTLHLTRIVPNNSAIKDRIIRSNPLVFEERPDKNRFMAPVVRLDSIPDKPKKLLDQVR